MPRLLPDLVADGTRQMALDEALLEAALGPTLRTYAWEPAAVSLGYFQDYASIAPRLPSGMPVVRRITGGGAIWHEHEVTYSLVGQLGSGGFPLLVKDLYPLLHGAVLRALAARGARLETQERTEGDRRYRDEPRCFASPAADDLIHHAGGKVLGSAARARGQRVLIHGSLKLASNPWDLDAVRGCGLAFAEARTALIDGICTALGDAAAPGQLTDEEMRGAERVHTARYASPGWVQERSGPRP